MTDSCYAAKQWLNRNRDFFLQLEADRRLLQVVQNRISSGVAQYESDGSGHDSYTALGKHEDMLGAYVELREKIEKEEIQYLSEVVRTRQAIEYLSKPVLIAIATDRYVNSLSWQAIEDLEHVSHSQVHRYHAELLQEMADILPRHGFL